MEVLEFMYTNFWQTLSFIVAIGLLLESIADKFNRKK